MKKLFLMSKVVAALVAATVVTGCSDEIVQPQIKSSDGELLSRGAYDYPAVEWDNVDHIAVVCNREPSETSLPLPWNDGSSGNYGIPSDWIDHDRKNPDPKKRIYSRQNGWEMVCHNLSDPAEFAKYFGLYNKHTGVLRLFFYEISSAASEGTSNAWTALRVSGSTGLLNFSGSYPLAMNDRMTNPMVFASTECNIKQNSMPRSGYKANNWYGLEVELAYDANAVSTNKLSAKLWAQFLTSISMSGTAAGEIQGNIQTVYSNSPTINNNISLTANIGNTTIRTGEEAATNELKAKADKGGNFFNNLWNNIKGQLPQLAGKAAKEGIDALLSGGTSLITHGLSKLLGLSGRKTSQPMTSTSKVNLGITSQLSLTGTTETSVVGFGAISDFALPQFASNNKLYTGKLGVWNLQDYPNLYVDLMMTSMYYPKELVPNPSCPRAYYPTYTYTLSSGTVVVNPDILKDYKVENLWQDLVFTSNAFSSIGTVSKKEYGIDGTHEYYEPQNGSRSISVQGEMEDFRIMNFNPNTSYERFWNGYDKPANGNSIMCHVYFELVSKTDSNERYAYSKYFPVKAVKRNYSHREETITQ